MDNDIDHLLFEDECMIRGYQALQNTWFEKGKQRIIPTTSKHRGVKLLATVDYVTVNLSGKKTSSILLKFGISEKSSRPLPHRQDCYRTG